MSDLIDRQAAIKETWKEPSYTDPLNVLTELRDRIKDLPSAEPEPCEDAGEKTCRTCHLWEDGEINIACPWGSNYEHYEDDYCSLWEKQN